MSLEGVDLRDPAASERFEAEHGPLPGPETG